MLHLQLLPPLGHLPHVLKHKTGSRPELPTPPCHGRPKVGRVSSTTACFREKKILRLEATKGRQQENSLILDLSHPLSHHSACLREPLTFSTCSRLSSLLCRPWLLRRAESRSCFTPRSCPFSSAFSHSTWRGGIDRAV